MDEAESVLAPIYILYWNTCVQKIMSGEKTLQQAPMSINVAPQTFSTTKIPKTHRRTIQLGQYNAKLIYQREPDRRRETTVNHHLRKTHGQWNTEVRYGQQFKRDSTVNKNTHMEETEDS